MNKLNEILAQPEGRRLEFKETIPSKADLAKAIIAFANDAGGDFYLGIKDMPREITGLNEDELKHHSRSMPSGYTSRNFFSYSR